MGPLQWVTVTIPRGPQRRSHPHNRLASGELLQSHTRGPRKCPALVLKVKAVICRARTWM